MGKESDRKVWERLEGRKWAEFDQNTYSYIKLSNSKKIKYKYHIIYDYSEFYQYIVNNMSHMAQKFVSSCGVEMRINKKNENLKKIEGSKMIMWEEIGVIIKMVGKTRSISAEGCRLIL